MADFQWAYTTPVVRTTGATASIDQVKLNFNTKRLEVVFTEKNANGAVIRIVTRTVPLSRFDAFLNLLAQFPGETTEERLIGALHTIDAEIPSDGAIESTIPVPPA